MIQIFLAYLMILIYCYHLKPVYLIVVLQCFDHMKLKSTCIREMSGCFKITFNFLFSSCFIFCFNVGLFQTTFRSRNQFELLTANMYVCISIIIIFQKWNWKEHWSDNKDGDNYYRICAINRKSLYFLTERHHHRKSQTKTASIPCVALRNFESELKLDNW